MAAGTDYITKQALLDAIALLVFPNTTFQTTADNEQTALNDIVETLFPKLSPTTAISITYNDLITAIAGSTLLAGQTYAVPYECIHLIPGTTVLNTASPQYVQVIETFYILAVEINILSPIVTSKQFPEDIIYWDHTEGTAEDVGLTPRPGKVLFRHDQLNQLTAYYDWRNVLLRRGTVDQGATTTWTTGQNWLRGDVVDDGLDDTLYRAGLLLTLNTVFDQTIWFNATGVTNNVKWVWKDAAPFIGTTVVRNNLEDFKTFTGCTNCSIAQTSLNNGYNNIVLTSSTFCHIGDNSTDCHLASCTNINVHVQITNCYLQGCTIMEITNAAASSFQDVQKMTIVDSFDDIWNLIKDTQVGTSSTNNSTFNFNSVSLGSDAVDNTMNNIKRSSLGENYNANYLQNIEDCTLRSSLDTNRFIGLRFSDIGNDVNNCQFNLVSSYGLYEYVRIESGCNNITSDDTISINYVVFGGGCNNITFGTGASVNNVTFGPNCDTILVNNASTLNQATIGTDCSTLTITNGSNVTGLTIGDDCTNIVFTDGGTSTGLTIGNNCSVFLIEQGAVLSSCTFGNGCSIITSSNGPGISNCSFGDAVTNIVVSNGGTLADSSIDAACTAFFVDNGAFIRRSRFGTRCTSITVTAGAIIDDTELQSDCIIFVVDAGSNVTGCVFSPLNTTHSFLIGSSVDNCRFDSGCSNFTITDGSIVDDNYFGASSDDLLINTGSTIRGNTFNLILPGTFPNVTTFSSVTITDNLIAKLQNCVFDGVSFITNNNIGEMIDCTVSGGSTIDRTFVGRSINSLNMTAASQILLCSIASNVDTLILNGGSQLSTSILQEAVNTLTFTAGAAVKFMIAENGAANKTFDGTALLPFHNARLRQGDTIVTTYNQLSDMPGGETSNTTTVAVGITAIDFAAFQDNVFAYSEAATFVINCSRFPQGREISFVIENTGAGVITVTWTDNNSTISVANAPTTTIAVGETEVIKIARYDDGSGTYRLIKVSELILN